MNWINKPDKPGVWAWLRAKDLVEELGEIGATEVRQQDLDTLADEWVDGPWLYLCPIPDPPKAPKTYPYLMSLVVDAIKEYRDDQDIEPHTSMKRIAGILGVKL